MLMLWAALRPWRQASSKVGEREEARSLRPRPDLYLRPRIFPDLRFRPEVDLQCHPRLGPPTRPRSCARRGLHSIWQVLHGFRRQRTRTWRGGGRGGARGWGGNGRSHVRQNFGSNVKQTYASLDEYEENVIDKFVQSQKMLLLIPYLLNLLGQKDQQANIQTDFGDAYGHSPSL